MKPEVLDFRSFEQVFKTSFYVLAFALSTLLRRKDLLVVIPCNMKKRCSRAEA